MYLLELRSTFLTKDIPIAEVKRLIEAANSLGKGVIPGSWYNLLNAGWAIRKVTCKCGGEYAWIDEMDQVYGCVCHNTPDFVHAI